jgi:hypothetical protein
MMFKNADHKKKLRFLWIGFALAWVLIYFVALRDTLSLIHDCSDKQKKVEESKKLESAMTLLRAELAVMDKKIGSRPDTTKKVFDLLLDNITGYCNGKECTIKEIPASSRAVSNGYEVETYFITLEGSFKQLLDLVYLLEQRKKTGGHIASLLFFVNKNSHAKKHELRLMLYIQHYNKI